MTSGAKQSSSPLEGETTKVLIVELAGERTPFLRVANPNEPTTAKGRKASQGGLSDDNGDGNSASPQREVTGQPTQDQKSFIVADCVAASIPTNDPPNPNPLAFNDPTIGQIAHRHSTSVLEDDDNREVDYGRSIQCAARSPSSGLSYATDRGHITHNIESMTVASVDGSDPPANRTSVSRRPTVIPITSSEYSQCQRGSLSRNSSMPVEGNGQSITNICETFGGERWTRGAFTIGRSAPVKIDEGIEVHLRAGANGEVDFIIL